VTTPDPVRDLAARFWDAEIGPDLASDGVPDDALNTMKANYINAILANPEAIQQLLALMHPIGGLDDDGHLLLSDDDPDG
jgi:hypothetical protein